MHDRHCSCCVGVWSGALRDAWFRAIGATEAVAIGEAMREPGFVACMMPCQSNPRRMLNADPDEAISIQVCGFGREAHASSIQRAYGIVAG